MFLLFLIYVDIEDISLNYANDHQILLLRYFDIESAFEVLLLNMESNREYNIN